MAATRTQLPTSPLHKLAVWDWRLTSHVELPCSMWSSGAPALTDCLGCMCFGMSTVGAAGKAESCCARTHHNWPLTHAWRGPCTVGHAHAHEQPGWWVLISDPGMPVVDAVVLKGQEDGIQQRCRGGQGPLRRLCSITNSSQLCIQ